MSLNPLTWLNWAFVRLWVSPKTKKQVDQIIDQLTNRDSLESNDQTIWHMDRNDIWCYRSPMDTIICERLVATETRRLSIWIKNWNSFFVFYGDNQFLFLDRDHLPEKLPKLLRSQLHIHLSQIPSNFNHQKL